MERARIAVTGIVQGVGFRPFVYNLAAALALKGWVLNSSRGVTIEVEGPSATIDTFVERLRANAPPLSCIETLTVERLPGVGFTRFVIRESLPEADAFTLISPDVATCDDCLAEMLDPADRRYRYPFTNCTNCGPRYSITLDVPYDRPQTTMRVFPMCPACQAEYDDPGNRRFHAQPNACPACGPQVWLVPSAGPRVQGSPPPATLHAALGTRNAQDAVAQAVSLLRAGCVVAIKGIGGFHLACDATNAAAVRRLREGKRKSEKAFAIMCASVDAARRYCRVSAEEAAVLTAPTRPIVLLGRLPGGDIAAAVAPKNRHLGMMLPYTPLHHLLFAGRGLGALVMTSGNLAEEPIVVENDEALHKLAALADYFLLHDRDIYMRVDDSVTRWAVGEQRVARRARGYVPQAIRLGGAMPEILAVGAELKHTFTLTKGAYAIVSQHIGDLENYEALQFFQETLANLSRSFRVAPRIVAHDLHPAYLSTRFALEQRDAALIGVQHHHAHVASCLAENGVHERVIGVSFDGTGYGGDGQVWGGEFLLADRREFLRAAHLRYVRLPGGEAAIRRPLRMAYAFWHDALGEAPDALEPPALAALDRHERQVIQHQLRSGLNSPLTSSMGRLFDAVSALAGICDRVTYEGQAAMELESSADMRAADCYDWALERESGELDARPLVRAVVADLRRGAAPSIIAGRFHRTVAEMVVRTCEWLREEHGLNAVALSGGVFQNVILLALCDEGLRQRGFRVLTQRLVPCNDGGVSLGQAAVAAARVGAH